MNSVLGCNGRNSLDGVVVAGIRGGKDHDKICFTALLLLPSLPMDRQNKIPEKVRD